MGPAENDQLHEEYAQKTAAAETIQSFWNDMSNGNRHSFQVGDCDSELIFRISGILLISEVLKNLPVLNQRYSTYVFMILVCTGLYRELYFFSVWARY